MNNKNFLATVALISMFPLSILGTTFNTDQSPIQTCINNNPYHIIVNKQQAISDDFIPANLVVPNVKFSFSGTHEKKHMEAAAAYALEELFAGAKEDNIHLFAVSGYRSYSRQATLYNTYVQRDGQEQADTYSARPGTSEHQTGLSIDVSAASVDYDLTTSFAYTTEGTWLAQHAHEYGFIIRYPKGKESITGYMYEPWHIRYVGHDLASTVYSTDLTLEELDRCCSEKIEIVESLAPSSISPIFFKPEANKPYLPNPLDNLYTSNSIQVIIDERLTSMTILSPVHHNSSPVISSAIKNIFRPRT